MLFIFTTLLLGDEDDENFCDLCDLCRISVTAG